MNRLYSAFGLVVESTLELPVTNLIGHADRRPADVTVCVHRCLDGSESDTGAPGSITASPSAAALYWEDVGEYRVSDGRRIDIRPLPGVPAHVLSLFVMGTAFAMLLYQRGYTVLHGSVAELDGCGMGFLGHKGAGKSTLAMSLQQIGGRLIADDLVAVQMEPEVLALSGFRQMKLWPDSLHHLGYQPDELARLRPELEKRGVLFAPAQRPTAARLSHLFVVQQSEEISIVPLSEKEALLALLPHWYAARFGTAFVRQLQAQATQFMQCVALAREVRVSLLKRPLTLAALPRVAEAIGDFVGARPARGRTRRAAQTQRRAAYARSNEGSR